MAISPFVDTSDLGGLPDGATVDADGLYWVAVFRGSKVAAYRPDGSLARVIDMPVELPSSVAFGGPDWGDLYLVTADDLEQPDRKGGIWRCRPGVTGHPTPMARV